MRKHPREGAGKGRKKGEKKGRGKKGGGKKSSKLLSVLSREHILSPAAATGLRPGKREKRGGREGKKKGRIELLRGLFRLTLLGTLDALAEPPYVATPRPWEEEKEKGKEEGRVACHISGGDIERQKSKRRRGRGKKGRRKSLYFPCLP